MFILERALAYGEYVFVLKREFRANSLYSKASLNAFSIKADSI